MTPDRELELRVLNLLRQRDVASRLLDPVQQVIRQLSPEGQLILRALGYAQANGAASEVSVRTIWLILSEQWPNKDLAHVQDWLREMNGLGEDDPALIDALASQFVQRAKLKELSIRAASAVESGQEVDAAFVEDLVKLAKPASSAEEAAFWRFDARELQQGALQPERIPTPWTGVNEEIEGGYLRGELVEVCALSKAGKTHFLVNDLCGSLYLGHSVGYVTISDLDRQGIALMVAQVLLKKDRRTLLADPTLLAGLHASMEHRGLFFEIADYTNRPCRVTEVERAVERWTNTHGTNLVKVAVDRLEEAVPSERLGVPRLEIAAMWRLARQVARRYNVPILVDSQAGAHVQGRKRIRITDGSESKIGKAAILDLFFGLATDLEDATKLYVSIEGRRPVSGHLLRLRRDPVTHQLTEEW